MLKCPREEPHDQPPADAEMVAHDMANAKTTIKAVRLKINELRKEDSQTSDIFGKRKQVRTFLINLPWKDSENEEEGGITWVELYFLYRLHGWNQNSESENFLTEKTR